MITITHEETINRPVEDLFAFIADPTNDPRWCPPVLEAEQVAGNGPEEGARYRQIVKPGPKQLTNNMAITEYEPNRRIAWQGSNEMLEFHGRYEVGAVNGGTRVVMTSNLAARGILRLLEPLLSRASRSVAEEEFQNLKQLLEGERARASIRA